MKPDLAYIALGSNLGDPLQQLRTAGEKLPRLGQVVARSSLYRSPAQGGRRGSRITSTPWWRWIPFPLTNRP